jgi:hypothetical protein
MVQVVEAVFSFGFLLNSWPILDVEMMIYPHETAKLLVVMVEVEKVVEPVVKYQHVIEVMFDFLIVVIQ